MISCVICAGLATIFCENDKALLCKDCDVRIHTSNPVAARHRRRPACEGACSNGATLHCRCCSAFICSACHEANPLAANHEVEVVNPLPPIEQDAPAPEQPQFAPCESVAQSAPSPESWFLEEFAGDKPGDMQVLQPVAAEEAAVSPTGSEAVVPVMSPNFDEFAFTAPNSFKDIKDKLEFEALELDNGWLEGVNFDFTDILSDAPSDAGLVPSFDPEVVAATDAAELATVPSFELPDVMVPEISGFDLPEVPVAEQAEEEEEEAETAPSRKRPAPFASQEPQPKVQALPQQPLPTLAQPQTFFFPPQMLPVPPAPVAVPAPAAPKASTYNPAVYGNGANLTREQRVARYREKRKNRKFEKTIRYASRKAYAEIRPRIKGRFAKKEEIEAWKAAHGGDDAVVPEILDEI